MAEKPQDAYFKIDPECHLIGEMDSINHFPGVQMWWRAILSMLSSRSTVAER